jgi:hypothetical protein
MKLITPEILWHGEKLPERVYSVDFQYNSLRLATGGADPDVHVRPFRLYSRTLACRYTRFLACRFFIVTFSQ